jgi:hypothetical protein
MSRVLGSATARVLVLSRAYSLRNNSTRAPKSILDRSASELVETDECGIPRRPTWSVGALLSSYPKPSIAPDTLKRLHSLSALIPPEEGSPEHAQLTREMEDLVSLVEAVRLVDVDPAEAAAAGPVPDGRIWAKGAGMQLDHGQDRESVDGRALLQHAERTASGLYVVEADRTAR